MDISTKAIPPHLANLSRYILCSVLIFFREKDLSAVKLFQFLGISIPVYSVNFTDEM